MKKKIVSFMLVFALIMSSFTFITDDAHAAKKVWKEYSPDRYGDVTKTAALRSSSSSKSKSLGSISKGKRIKIYGYDKYSSGSWYKAKYNNKIGYVYAKKVKLSYQAYTPAKIGVTTANLYIRSGVGLDYSKKKYVKKGTTVKLYGYYRTVGPDWYKVSYGNTTGYLSSKYVKRTSNSNNAKWVNYNPHRYGDINEATALKKDSNSTAATISVIPADTRILLYGYDRYSNDSWYKAKYNGSVGYVSADDVNLSYQAYTPQIKGKTTANLYIRSGVGLDYSKKKYIKKGTTVKLYGYYRTAGPDWYKVSYGGRIGYLSSKYVKRDGNVVGLSPVINKFITTTSYVKISWQKAKYASKYEIHRKEGSGAYQKIATVSGDMLQYKDDKIEVGKSYTYKITAIYGNNSYESVARKVTPVEIEAPKLKHVKRYQADSKESVQFNWEAKAGSQYYVYKKTIDGSWIKLATVKAKSSTGTYTDKDVEAGVDYIYTAKEVRKVGEILYKYGDYDSGIKTIANKPENIKADAGTLNTKVTWDKVDGATAYKVYRKIGRKGEYRLLATVKDNEFTDVYYDNAKTDKEKSYLCATYFTDPSINPYVYTVRAFDENDGKESYSDYYRDGDFHRENPAIINVQKIDDHTATYEWSNPVNPVGYILYSGTNNGSGKVAWTQVAEVKRQSGGRLKATVNVDPSHDYFTVQAKYEKDGQYVYSGYDEGYTIKNQKYSNNNILYLGDSITYGSPYKSVGATKEVYSYPYRVQQLTGVNTCNPSIPGSTWSSDPYDKFRYSMTKDVADQIAQGKSVSSRVPENETVHKNTDGKTFADFDVVVLAAGTNDYTSITQLGDLDSTNDVEFNGALNKIMNYIKEANEVRAKINKEPIKVVFVELFYSDRTDPHMYEIHNRFKTKNRIGLTLTDYQNSLNAQANKWREKGLDIYNFDTTKFVDENTCKYNTSDNLHMNRFTYTQVGNDLAQFMIDNKIIK